MTGPPTVAVHNASRRAPWVLTCEHAGRAFETDERLGLSEIDATRHIAWDIGAYAVAMRLSETLRAPLVAQLHSRLIIDCNRQRGAPDLIPELVDGTHVPGNAGIAPDERRRRIKAFHEPFHAAVAALLSRTSVHEAIALVSIHSFSPSLHGQARPWEVGLCYRPGARFGTAFFDRLSRDRSLCVGDNQPYGLDPINDGTLPLHKPAGENAVLIELRQDLVSSEAGQALMARCLANALQQSILTE